MRIIFIDTETTGNADSDRLVQLAVKERYIDELEKEGKLTQHGTIGQGVFYTPN